MTARLFALLCTLIVLMLLLGAALGVLLGQASPTPVPTCRLHYVLLGHVGADRRAYVEVTVPPDGVCMLDMRRQLTQRKPTT